MLSLEAATTILRNEVTNYTSQLKGKEEALASITALVCFLSSLLFPFFFFLFPLPSCSSFYPPSLREKKRPCLHHRFGLFPLFPPPSIF
jgi:hypothetical protein